MEFYYTSPQSVRPCLDTAKLTLSATKDILIVIALLFMASLPIEEVKSLKILGFHFDRRLTWDTMIHQLSTCCRQQMEASYRLRDYLSPKGLAVAFRSFVRPFCEYDGVSFIGASATHFDKEQKLAERLSGCVFPALKSSRAASAIRLLCELLNSHGGGQL